MNVKEYQDKFDSTDVVRSVFVKLAYSTTLPDFGDGVKSIEVNQLAWDLGIFDGLKAKQIYKDLLPYILLRWGYPIRMSLVDQLGGWTLTTPMEGLYLDVRLPVGRGSFFAIGMTRSLDKQMKDSSLEKKIELRQQMVEALTFTLCELLKPVRVGEYDKKGINVNGKRSKKDLLPRSNMINYAVVELGRVMADE